MYPVIVKLRSISFMEYYLNSDQGLTMVNGLQLAVLVVKCNPQYTIDRRY
jgi:hypothetical protein